MKSVCLSQSTIVALKYIITALAMMLWTSISVAGEKGDVEVSIIVPHIESIDVTFDGGARAEIEKDVGFGFGFSTFFTDQIVGRMNFSWNSSSYAATRILDDDDNTAQRFGGNYASFALGFGGDYYFTPGRIAPFVSAELGYFYIDSNIAAGRPQTVCWWDPWYGYICDVYQPSFGGDGLYYGLGLGVRMEFKQNGFVKLGYYENSLDVDRATSDPDVGVIRFELGMSVR